MITDAMRESAAAWIGGDYPLIRKMHDVMVEAGYPVTAARHFGDSIFRCVPSSNCAIVEWINSGNEQKISAEELHICMHGDCEDV